MKERKIVTNHDGLIDYKYIDAEIIYSYTDEEWDICVLKTSLIENGADEKTIDELYGKGYSMGYAAAMDDVAENDI